MLKNGGCQKLKCRHSVKRPFSLSNCHVGRQLCWNSVYWLCLRLWFVKSVIIERYVITTYHVLYMPFMLTESNFESIKIWMKRDETKYQNMFASKSTKWILSLNAH